MTEEWDELELEEDGDVYTRESRERKEDDDEIEGWQSAWMDGYDEG